MDDRGDIILDGLLRIVAGLLVAGLLLFETGAVVVNHIQVDSRAQEAAQSGARAWERHGNRSVAEAAVVEAAVGLPGTVVRANSVQPDAVIVTVSRPAPVLFADRIPPLRSRLEAHATARVPIER